MKKIILGMAALAAVTAVSCSDKGSADNTANADKYSVPEATSDSVNSYFGSFVGTSILGEYSPVATDTRVSTPPCRPNSPNPTS